ncbi:Crp/Fnr family transcriptional regulator [Vreelandella massiliensis]|uniref:Crp/Fnr family transcriptional regulator n=1 Tax=Vreelandella massiliensis TaxID=1816686 RepID=UPI00096AC361|nr:Crp/Fnr family transcriptional regulator [Halomonas massiliensis]
MAPEESCIIRHFEHYRRLSPKEKEILASLEKAPTAVSAGTTLWQEGKAASEFCTLSAGWAYSYRNLDCGSRQIMEIFLPGDIIGLREFAFNEHLEGVTMIEDGTVCYFPHRRLLELFRDSLTLTTVTFAISNRQQALLCERLVTLARHSARQRLAHFLHEMYIRLRQTMPEGGPSFRLPLSQQQLGDLLGLTPVHVSRTLSAMSEDGLIYRNHHTINVPDIKALAEEASFNDLYLNTNLRPLFEDAPPES